MPAPVPADAGKYADAGQGGYRHSACRTREGDAMEFHITEDDIASVMTEALLFPVEDTAVKISRDGTIAVTAAVTRQALGRKVTVPGKAAHGAVVCRSAVSCTARGAQLFQTATQPCLPDHQAAGRLHLPEQTAQALPMRSSHSGIPVCGTAGLTQTIQWWTGKRCRWDNRSTVKKNPFGKPKDFWYVTYSKITRPAP